MSTIILKKEKRVKLCCYKGSSFVFTYVGSLFNIYIGNNRLRSRCIRVDKFDSVPDR